MGSRPSTANSGIGECVQPVLMWPTNMATLCPVFYLECGNLDNWFDQAASKVSATPVFIAHLLIINPAMNAQKLHLQSLVALIWYAI